MNDWISAKIKPPPLHMDVILHYLDGTILIGNRFRFGYLYEGIHGRVTHWMPLPAAPT